MLFLEIHPYWANSLQCCQFLTLTASDSSLVIYWALYQPETTWVFFCYMALQSLIIFLFFACKCSSITFQRNRWLTCSPHIFILISSCVYLFQTANTILTNNTRWKVCERWSSPMPLYPKPVSSVSEVFPVYLFNLFFKVSCDGDPRLP